MFLAVGTCKMCILCSVLVALEAAGNFCMSLLKLSCVSQIGLYICQTYTGLESLHTHRKGILSIPTDTFILYHLQIQRVMVLSSKCSVA